MNNIYKIFDTTNNIVEQMTFASSAEAEAYINEHKDSYYHCHVEIFYYDKDMNDRVVKAFDVV